MKNASSNSELVACVARYLGYPPETPVGEDVLQRIDRAVEDVEQLSSFHYLYAHFTEPLEFMRRNDAYMKHLSGAEGFLLCATTLGAQVDRHLKRLELTDMSYAIVFDAAASAYLEFKADEYERALPYPNRGFRFCPGYGGTPLEDSRDIVTRLRADRRWRVLSSWEARAARVARDVWPAWVVCSVNAARDATVPRYNLGISHYGVLFPSLALGIAAEMAFCVGVWGGIAIAA